MRARGMIASALLVTSASFGSGTGAALAGERLYEAKNKPPAELTEQVKRCAGDIIKMDANELSDSPTCHQVHYEGYTYGMSHTMLKPKLEAEIKGAAEAWYRDGKDVAKWGIGFIGFVVGLSSSSFVLYEVVKKRRETAMVQELGQEIDAIELIMNVFANPGTLWPKELILMEHMPPLRVEQNS